MHPYRSVSCALLGFALAGGCFDAGSSDTTSATTGNDAGNSPHGGHRGAIFTTLVEGSRVNANRYAAKADVYLDGGPRGGSPSSAAALSEGDYFFQVTDPSGKHLLSSDHISCRKVHVSGAGVITQIAAGTTYTRAGSTWTAAPCQHAHGVDSDHTALGALTVQLAPYDDTPNHGGEYKVWVTPVAQYTGDPAFVPGQGDHDQHGTTRHGGIAYGFEPRFSKTDNFKVRPDAGDAPPCGDGVVDASEECDDGNTINGDGCSAACTEDDVVPSCCGDGVVDSGEQCDDGNTSDGDGCSAICTLELPPPPPPPPACCGNGLIEAGETCDDGNTISGDGCSAVCAIEGGGSAPDLQCDGCVTTRVRT